MSNKHKDTAETKTDKPVLVPKLRFPEFLQAGVWKSDCMGNLYDYLGNNSFSRDMLNYNSGVLKNIHYGDIHTKYATLFDIENEKVPFINTAEIPDKIKPENYCKEGDLIFADASEDLADVGKSIEVVRLHGQKLVSGLHTILARQKTAKVALGFAGHLFKSDGIRTQIKKQAQGAKVLGLSARRLAQIIVTYPHNKLEQQKIADCLSSIDDLTMTQAQKVEALKKHKKGLMQLLFPAEGETVPKLRFPEFSNAKEWKETTLGQLGDLVAGLTYSPDDVTDSGLLVLRSSNIQDGYIALQDNVYVTPDVKGANFSQPNDILVCVRNGSKNLIGKNALIPEGLPVCTHGAFMTAFRSKSWKFVLQLFKTAAYQKQVNGDLGATINSINGSNFIKYKFFVPLPPEQERIADALSSVDELITAQVQKVEALKTHKKGLMQQLFAPPLDEAGNDC